MGVLLAACVALLSVLLKPRRPAGILKVIKETRQEALQAASELLGRGMVLVTVIADGRVYTMEEFRLTIIDISD